MAARRPDSQLALLDVPVFAGGPPRLPKARGTKAAAPSTLPLPFDPEAARRRAEAELQARVEERMRGALRPKTPAPPPPPPQPNETEIEPLLAEGPVAEWLFGWRKKPTNAERSEFFERLAARLGLPSPRRVSALELREEGDRLSVRVDGQIVRAVATGAGAKVRWRSAVAEVAREAGLVEPE